MATTNLTAQVEALQAAPVLYIAGAFVIAGLVWVAFRILYDARIDRLKQDADSEKRENERLRARVAELEARGPAAPAPSRIQIELEAWCRRWLDDARKQLVTLKRIVEESDPWSDAGLKRSALHEISKLERFVPSSKIANSNTAELAQEFFLDALVDYDGIAEDLHSIAEYSSGSVNLNALAGYLEWRRVDALLLRELHALLASGEFPIVSARLPNDWGEAQRSEGWPAA